jgi:tetratricopeptide (TPR) repeat protein
MNTIQETLQLAIQEHQNGNLNEAERCYQTILQSEPNHGDANHNFALLTRQIYSTEKAIPLLEKALESNKLIEQYWLSYIETLIEINEIDKANNTIDEAKKYGINEEKIANLSEQILEIKKTGQNFFFEIKNLIKFFNENKVDQAEDKAKYLTQHLPTHFLPWKILGVLL